MKRNTFFENLDRNGLPTGGRKAYWAYKLSMDTKNDIFEICDSLDQNEARDFTYYLGQGDIKEFILTIRNTSLMETILSLTASGCIIMGPGQATRIYTSEGKRYKKTVPELRFRTKE